METAQAAETSEPTPARATPADAGVEPLPAIDDLPALAPSCARAGDTWAPVDDTAVVERLFRAAGKLPWGDHSHGPPQRCHLRARLRCAPDLDGNGMADTLVQLDWSIRIDEAIARDCATLDPHDGSIWPAGSMLAFSGTIEATAPGPLEAFAVVGYAVQDGQNDLGMGIRGFVRLPDGRVGLRGGSRYFDSGSGCDVYSDWVGRIEGGALRILATTEREDCGP